jgi:hypothetical protein
MQTPFHPSVGWQITRAKADTRVSLPVQFVKKRVSATAFLRRVCSVRWLERFHFRLNSGGDHFKSGRATSYPASGFAGFSSVLLER